MSATRRSPRHELRRRLTDADLTTVDVRVLPAYNGWRSNGEARGGHVPGAVAFPSAWLTSVDDAEIAVETELDHFDVAGDRQQVDEPSDELVIDPLLQRTASQD